MLRRIVRRLTDPWGLAYTLRSLADRGGLYRRYAQLARQAGLKRLYFILSFDCDTPEDAEVAWDVHARLRAMGVTPVFAVPGELLKQGRRVYRRILEDGAEFINHGYRQHTYFDKARGAYASCFFYDQESPQDVRDDIMAGDRNLRATLGVEPRGFRTPHFGTFQRPDQLRFLHRVLGELGYAFSTSTVPLYAYRFGPVFRNFGILELPVSGMASRPLRILDSWTCFAAPKRRFEPKHYLDEGCRVAERFHAFGVGLLNFYADPSHIHDRPEFFTAVANWVKVAQPVTYNQLLAKLT